MHLPVIPDNAPFNPSQRLWLNGYLAGLFSGTNAGSTAVTAPSSPSLGRWLFAYGTQTGGAETLARKFSKHAGKLGFEPSVAGLESLVGVDLSEHARVAIIVSTYGDGDMPDNAQAFWDFLNSESAPNLGHIEYSVLALGDLNYPLFCEAGKKIDARLAELGARRIQDRVDCDVDFEELSDSWFKNLSTKLVGNPAVHDPAPPGEEPEALEYGKSRPFPARLKTNRKINQDGSAKETRHIELVLEGSGLEYEAGDALGVMPRNCPDFVEEILAASGHSGEEELLLAGGAPSTLRNALVLIYDLKPFLSMLPKPGMSASELIAPLRKLQARLYSIASSPKAHPGEVHLTLGVVRYEVDGIARKGVCSTFLADFESRSGGVETAPVFIHRSPHFKLPVNTDLPVIMVGPGTGIAPFRSFLEERLATGSKGRNWLFFGDQKRATDFLYEEELTDMLTNGHLTRLDLAFSRDQEHKTYVQNRMIEHAVELWKWFQDGAVFYVCGDAQRMAKDVEAALLQVAREAGGHTDSEAAQWLATLKSEKRYLRDVY